MQVRILSTPLMSNPYEPKDHIAKDEEAIRFRDAVMLAISQGRWAPVEAGLSEYPIDVHHCAHCDRYSGEFYWHHRSCLVTIDRSGKKERT